MSGGEFRFGEPVSKRVKVEEDVVEPALDVSKFKKNVNYELKLEELTYSQQLRSVVDAAVYTENASHDVCYKVNPNN